MMIMKRLLLLLCCSGAFLCGAELSGVHSVYFLPMSRGLDQYLANRVTNDHIFQVVTNPKLADAVFTDRIGEAFESQMQDLFPPPAAEKPKPEPKKDGKKEDQPKASGLPTDTVNKQTDPSLNSAFGRGKGMVFLVDVKSRQVIWSAYDPPKGAALTDLDHSASDIVAKLKKELYPNPKK
ncbi:conserved exported hypothetical protein [Candidatus Sulfopaludibacter sp. SbA4]|nr:conserved exported hypothetical protein [Candidatus Sulfopaludibacter sp. SbA4]